MTDPEYSDLKAWFGYFRPPDFDMRKHRVHETV